MQFLLESWWRAIEISPGMAYVLNLEEFSHGQLEEDSFKQLWDHELLDQSYGTHFVIIQQGLSLTLSLQLQWLEYLVHAV